MAVVHGRLSYIGTLGVVNVVGFTVDESTDPYEVTALSVTNPTYKKFAVDGLIDYRGTISVLLDDTTPPLEAGTETAASVFCSAAGRTWTGTVLISNLSVTVNRNEEQVGTYNWVASAADFVKV